MISYFANRHYSELSKVLPPEFNKDQPSIIYYKTFINQDTLKLLEQNKLVNHKTLRNSVNKKQLKKKKPINIKVEQNLDVCPLCYQCHISVQLYGHRHICMKCRGFLRDQHGNQTKLFLNQKGDIICLGIKPKEVGEPQIVYYHTNYMKLEISGYSAFATFAGENELVILLRNKK